MGSIAQLLDEAETAVRSANDLAELDAVRVKYLGKKGLFTLQLREVGKLPADQIPVAGKAINSAKTALASAIDARRAALEARALEAQLAAEALDVTLPGRGERVGHLHPITRSLRRMISILDHAGFDVHTGPEVEDDFHNFTALNIPDEHPARAMHDTFYSELRPAAAHAYLARADPRAEAHGAPIRLIAPGRRLPSRFRPHAHADVHAGRRAADRSRRELCEPQSAALRLRVEVLRA